MVGIELESCLSAMAWGQWMVVNLTLEEQLEIEKQVRCALAHHDSQSVAKLCASLIRQNAYQSRLIKQATGHIAEIEMQGLLAERNT